MLYPSMHNIPTSRGNTVPAQIIWSDTAAVFDFQQQGSSLNITEVRGVWIDNSGNADELTVAVIGTLFSFKVRSGVSGTFPIFSNGLPKIEVSTGGLGGFTSLVFTEFDMAFFSYAVAEVGQTVTDTTLATVATTVGTGNDPAIRVSLGGGGLPDPLPVSFSGNVAVTNAAFAAWVSNNCNVTVSAFSNWSDMGNPVTDTNLQTLIGDGESLPTTDTTFSSLVGNGGKSLPTSDIALSKLIGAGDTLPTSDVSLNKVMNGASLSTVPGFAENGNVSVSVSGTSFVSFPAREVREFTVINNSGTDVEIQNSGSGPALPLTSGQSFTFKGVLNIGIYGVRRVDQASDAINVFGCWHN